MPKQGFTDATAPFTGLALNSLINGVAINGDTSEGNLGDKAWRSIGIDGTFDDGPYVFALGGGIVPEAPGTRMDADTDFVGSFGLLREVALRLSPEGSENRLGALYQEGEDTGKYPVGPYAFAAKFIEEPLAGQRQKVIDYMVANGAANHPWASFTPPTASAAVALLTANTTVWGTGSGTPDTLANMIGIPGATSGSSTFFAVILGLATNSLLFPTFTVPTLTWVAPTGGSITAATITAPTAVTVADNVDAAVESFTTLANTRLAADQAQLRASMFSTRQVMSTAFDGALAILAANAAAQIADYDKSARLDQARTQAQADMEHQRLSVQVGSQNAQLGLDADKANSQFALSAKDTETRFRLGAASAITAVESAANEVGLSIMRARGELLRMIYDTTIAWMGAKASILTNAGPVASVINNAYDLQYKADFTGRQQEMEYMRDVSSMATQYASAMSAQAGVKWNAMTQNMELYRTAISTAAGVGGQIHKPSTFDNVSAVVGMGAGLISTGIQVALAFAG
jgi:hypothetical protein